MVIDPKTGIKAKFSSKNTIIESYKSKNVHEGKILYSNKNRLNTNNILKFLLMNDKYLDFKKEIEKINYRVKGIFEKKDIYSKLENHNKKMLEEDFWQDKLNSQKIIKEKNFLKI